MFAAIQFRLCLSLIPVMLSIPFAWKVHEKKMLNARQNMNNLSVLEERESVDKKPVETEAVNSILETKEVGETGEPDEVLNEEISEMHHLLGITFGKESKLNILNLVSVLKNDGWIDAKLKPMLAFLNKRMKALYDDCYDVLKAQMDFKLLTINFFGVFILLYLKPVIKSCCSYGLRLLVSPFIKCFSMFLSFCKSTQSFVGRSFAKRWSKPKAHQLLEDTAPRVVVPQSLSNIKDPESISPSKASVDAEPKNVCRNDQAAMFDEKKNCGGLEERKYVETSEWLEDSFIEGGIQTFTPLENESGKSSNKTEDYLQFSNYSNTETNETNFEEPLRTSTPTKIKTVKSAPKKDVHEFNISKIYTPQKLRRFLHEKCDPKKGLEMTLDISKLDFSQCIVVDEQKRYNKGNDNSTELDDFVNLTKDKIRRRLINMSYV